jgi:cation diffusion facilitator CzcD-associated flavoprotein CzcO
LAWIALQQLGVDFLILEKADDIGGTWRDNTYPGCACDVPSHLYSFSFEPKADWNYLFSYQDEIWAYLQGVTDKYGLRRHIVFNSMLNRALWDEREYRWHVFTESGREYVAQFLISGAGALHIPSYTEFDGRDEFGRCFPLCTVGSHRRPHRQARRSHRHCGQRHPNCA